jgi:S1-C subfamily serine protease
MTGVLGQQVRKSPLSWLLASILILTAFGISPAAAAPGDVGSTNTVSAAQEAETDLSELVKEVNPAVVTVYNLTYLQDGMGETSTVAQGSGTGFVIDEQGHIVTNWHVVTGGEEFAVAMYDGTLVDAELIGLDPRDDLAVIKIDPSAVLKVVKLGDSDALESGQPVMAIGSPLGAFTNTVTSGIVSGLGRDDFGTLQGNCQNYSNLIQHSAPINPGNSGGPLFNLEGEVVGVNTLGLPLTQDGTTPLQGLFFAVPSNLVATIAEQLIQDGRISAPYLGITQRFIDQGTFAANGLDYEGGVLVEEVGSDTPAEEAGLEAEDVILAVDDRQITAEDGLPQILLDYQPGDEVVLKVFREGSETEVNLTFGNVPDDVLEACSLPGPEQAP